MEYAVALIVLLCLVALVVIQPLLGEETPRAENEGAREELEAAKQAKYREIRDAQLDLQMGKLSKQDHLAVDRELRAEAIEILRRLDKLDEGAHTG